MERAVDRRYVATAWRADAQRPFHHQIGLDVDIWFTPMPDHELSPEQREFDMALNMVAKDRRDVDPDVWTHERTAVVRAAAQDPVVTPHLRESSDQKGHVPRGRVRSVLAGEGPTLVGARRAFSHPNRLSIRQPGMQAATAAAASADGCGHELNSWLKETVLHPPSPGAKPKHNFPLSAMPKECREVVKAP